MRPNLAKIALVGVFAATLVTPLAWSSAVSTVPDASAQEKRELAPRPSFSFDRWSDFPQAFDSYFRDNFEPRNLLIHYNNELHLRLLGSSSVPKVIVGADRWLYYSARGDGADIRDFFGQLPLEDALLDDLLDKARIRQNECAVLGARFVLVLAPNKQTVYPEHLPSGWQRAQRTRIDQFVEAAASLSDLPLLDLRAALARAKADGELYYRYDSHWNDAGAFVAYRELAAWLATHVDGFVPRGRQDFEVLPGTRKGSDLAGMLSLGDELVDVDDRFVPRGGRRARLVESSGTRRVYETGRTDLPRAVLLGDSFATALDPFLAEHFSRLVFHNTAARGYDPNLLPEEKPDVVIQETVERYLPGQ